MKAGRLTIMRAPIHTYQQRIACFRAALWACVGAFSCPYSVPCRTPLLGRGRDWFRRWPRSGWRTGGERRVVTRERRDADRRTVQCDAAASRRFQWAGLRWMPISANCLGGSPSPIRYAPSAAHHHPRPVLDRCHAKRWWWRWW